MINRSAHTLLELVISMVAASVLLAGLASSVFIAVETFHEEPNSVRVGHAAEALAEIMRDLGRATSFTDRQTDSVTFTVPDEDGDGVEETLTYALDAGAGTITLTYNGVAATLVEHVAGAEFDFLERDVVGSAATPDPYDENDWGMRWGGTVVFEGYREAGANDVTTLNVPTPAGTAEGDLLVAAIVADKNATLVPPSGQGWHELNQQSHGSTNLTVGVWWKIADAAEPASHGFSHDDDEDTYGLIMRFTGHDPAGPINAFTLQAGTSSSPNCPSVTTTVDNALVLRIGGFDDEEVTVGEPGLAGHVAIAMGASDTSGSSCSGGAGYVTQGPAGNSGTANFALTDSEQYITFTVAIAPK